jgi:hypothetical protein
MSEKIVVRLVKNKWPYNLAIFKDNKLWASMNFSSKTDLAQYSSGIINGITLAAESLNLSFKQDGEYITLEEK